MSRTKHWRIRVKITYQSHWHRHESCLNGEKNEGFREGEIDVAAPANGESGTSIQALSEITPRKTTVTTMQHQQ